MTALTLTLITLAVTALGVAATLLWQGFRHFRELRKERAELARIDERLANLQQSVLRLDSGHDVAIARIEDLISATRADIEWLADERMIEQASALVRKGMTPDRISDEMGLSLDTARTIALFRGH